jgi:sugar phosphate isomerase/epimerase
MLEIGVMLNNLERDRHKAWRVAPELGFRIVDTSALPETWFRKSREPEGPDPQSAKTPLTQYVAAARGSGLVIHSMFVGFDGQSYTDPVTAAATVGLAVPALREQRKPIALAYTHLARELGATSLAMHVGHLQADRHDADLVATVAAVADHCAAHGLQLNLETGQEAAVELRQFIQNVDRPNVGVNFDPANFVLYGTDDPFATLQVLGPFVQGVHCKDAVPATAVGQMGTDVPLGQGTVDYRRLLPRLWALGYRGPLILEREHGPTIRADIQHGRAYLQRILTDLTP